MKIALSAREKNIGWVTLFTVLLWIFLLLFYNPKIKQQKKLSQELAALNTSIEETSLFFINQRNITQEISTLEQKLKCYEKKFSEKGKLNSFIEQLVSQCQQLNIALYSLRPRAAVMLFKQSPSWHYQQILIEMDLRCDYKAIALYMKALESLPMFVAVDTLEIRKGRDAALLEFHLVLETIWFTGNASPV